MTETEFRHGGTDHSDSRYGLGVMLGGNIRQRYFLAFFIFIIFMAVLANAAPAAEKKGKAAPVPAPAPDMSLSQRVSDLEQRVSDLEYRAPILGFRVDALEAGTARVSTEEEQYGLARTSYGSFAVKSAGVTPYLDGYKVKIAIGNLTSASFHGATIKVKWGIPFIPLPKGGDDYRRILKSRKEKEFAVNDIFRPGVYTDIELSVCPATPEEIKMLGVEITFDHMALQ